MSGSFESLTALRRISRESEHPAERVVATNKLAALMRKHNLIESDLDDSFRELEYFSIPANDPVAAKIAFQVLARFAPEAFEAFKDKVIMRSKGQEIYQAPMTKVEAVEIPLMIAHYIKDYREQSDAFMIAYFRRQDLIVLVDEGHPGIIKRTMKEEVDLAFKGQGITVNPHQKQLKKP
jgi:hypothetical protein